MKEFKKDTDSHTILEYDNLEMLIRVIKRLSKSGYDIEMGMTYDEYKRLTNSHNLEQYEKRFNEIEEKYIK